MPEPPTPRCPRCGYDQRGIVATWRESCPVEGVCSECGLGFLWRDVMRPGWVTPRWSFEHAPRRVVVRWFSTAWRALLIWPLWRGLRLEHPVASGRLAVHVGVVLLAMHGMVAGATAWLAYDQAVGLRVVVAGENYPDPMGTALPALAWPYAGFAMLLNAYGAPWRERALVLELEWAVLWWPLGAAASLLLLPQTFRRVRLRRSHVWRVAAYSLTPLPLGLLAALVGALERRGLNAVGEVAWLMGRYGLRPPRAWGPTLFGAMSAWMLAYWLVTPRRYLRLPHAGLVGVAALAVGGLVAAVVATVGWLVLVAR